MDLLFTCLHYTICEEIISISSTLEIVADATIIHQDNNLALSMAVSTTPRNTYVTGCDPGWIGDFFAGDISRKLADQINIQIVTYAQNQARTWLIPQTFSPFPQSMITWDITNIEFVPGKYFAVFTNATLSFLVNGQVVEYDPPNTGFDLPITIPTLPGKMNRGVVRIPSVLLEGFFELAHKTEIFSRYIFSYFLDVAIGTHLESGKPELRFSSVDSVNLTIDSGSVNVGCSPKSSNGKIYIEFSIISENPLCYFHFIKINILKKDPLSQSFVKKTILQLPAPTTPAF